MGLWQNFKDAVKKWALADEAKNSGVKVKSTGETPPSLPPSSSEPQNSLPPMGPPAPTYVEPPAPAQPTALQPVKSKPIYSPVQEGLSVTESVVRIFGGIASIVKDVAGIAGSSKPASAPVASNPTAAPPELIDDSSQVVD